MERLASPGRTAARYRRIGRPSLRQLSTMEKMAATLGPASLLPMCTQFRLPMATGLIEFSARLLDSSSTGYSRKMVSLSHSARVYLAAFPAALLGSCLLYTSDAADDLLCVDLGGRRIIKKKRTTEL